MWTVQESRNRPPKIGSKVFLCKYDKFQIVSYIKCNRLKMKHFQLQLVGKFARGRGRPPRKKEFPPKCAVLGLTQGDGKKLTSTATQTVERVADAVDISSRGMLDLSEWEVEETCFGDLLRGPLGDTLMPAGLFEEVTDHMKQLSKRKTHNSL